MWVTRASPSSEPLVAEPIPMWPGRAQLKEKTWVPLPMGSPVEGVNGVGCPVSWAAAEGRDFGDLILGF